MLSRFDVVLWGLLGSFKGNYYSYYRVLYELYGYP